MKIIEVTDRTPDLIGQLLDVWEASVRATHLFLTDGEISSIKAYVPQVLAAVYQTRFGGSKKRSDARRLHPGMDGRFP